MIREETRKKIFDYEAPPPPGAWANISAALGEKTPSKTVKIPVWVKYAASIVILAAAALAWWRSAENSAETSIASGTTITIPENSGVTIPAPATEEEATTAAVTHSARRSYTFSNGAADQTPPEHTPSPVYVSHTANFRSGGFGPGQIAQTLEKRLYREDGTDLVNENYIYLTTSDGNQVRVSRKIAAAVLADMGITESGASSFETIQLSQKIRSWKAQLAESSFIPSASNMMDLLSLMEVLDKN